MVVDSSIESDNARQLKVVKNHIIRYQNYFFDCLQCKDITIASIDAEGHPRPVPMSKISSKGCR